MNAQATVLPISAQPALVALLSLFLFFTVSDLPLIAQASEATAQAGSQEAGSQQADNELHESSHAGHSHHDAHSVTAETHSSGSADFAPVPLEAGNAGLKNVLEVGPILESVSGAGQLPDWATFLRDGLAAATACDANLGTDGATNYTLFNSVPRPSGADSLPANLTFVQVNPVEFTLQLDGYAVAVPRHFCLPLSPTQTVRLSLERFHVLNDDAKVRVADGDGELPIDPDPALFLEGSVDGIEGSHVYLAVFERYASGYIEIPATATSAARQYMIAPLGDPGDQTSTLVVYDSELVDLPTRAGHGVTEQNTGCASEHLSDYEERSRESVFESQMQRKGQKDRVQSSEILITEIAVDCDSQYYVDHGSNLSRSVNYARTVMGAASALYKRDVNMRLRVPYLRIWRSGDPYDDNNATEMLFDMRPHWNTNMRDVSRGLAHLFSGRNGIGGVAWVNVLCASVTNGFGYGVSGLRNNVSYPTTAYVWDTDVTAHELGHNFGSPHTHSCNWGTAIDSCWDAEGGCFPNRINRRGTIMSYCHLQSAGKGLYIHPIVASTIRFRAEAASCTYRENKSATNDVAVMSVELPAPGASIEDSIKFVPEVVVKNVGTADKTDLEVTFLIEEFDGTDVWSNKDTVDLDAGEVLHVKFDSTSLNTVGDYFASGEIALSGDSKLVNNEKKHQFAVVTSFSGTLDLESHNHDTTYVSGSTSKIEWDRSGISQVTIEFSPDDGANWFAVRYSQTASTEEFNWTVPAVNTDLGRIRIFDRNNAGLYDISDTTFSVSVARDIEVREILYPVSTGDDTASFVPRVEVHNNGSEVANNVPISFRLVNQVLRTETFITTGTITSIAANTIDTVDFPEASILQNGRYIMYARAFLPNDTDVSNDSVARYNDLIAPTVLVQEPNGFENWQVGSIQTIEWDNNIGKIAAVRLDYSTNSGASWNKIERSTANDGSYDWRVADAVGSDLRVRVADSKHAFIWDQSNIDFTISPMPKPNNIAVVTDGDSVKVTWTASGAQDLTGYRIYRGTSAGALSLIAEVAAASLEHKHGALSSGQRYFYDVRSLAGPYESDGATPVEYCPFEPTIFAESTTGLCTGESVVLDAGAGHASYLWNTGATTRKITVSQAGAYSVDITAAGGCQAITPAVDVTVSKLPRPEISADGPTTFCLGVNRILDVGSTFASVKWSNGSVNNSIAVSTPGIYSVTVTNANGCSASTTIQISLHPQPRPEISSDGPTTFCEGEDVTLDVGTTFASVKWNSGSVNNAITVTQSGVYVATVTNATGCSTTTSISVTVNKLPLPQISADGPTTFCEGQDLTLDVGTTFASVEWNNGSINNAITVTQSGIYTATVANIDGCSTSTSITVTVISFVQPSISTNGPTTFCSDQDITLDVGTAYASVKWNNGSVNNAITVNQSGVYSAVVTSANGCTESTSITLTVLEQPKPEISTDGPTTFCEGADVTLDVGTTFASVKWNTGSVNNLISVTQSGIYTATVTSANGCSASTSISVTVFPLPPPVISTDGPTTFCSDQDVTLDVGTAYASVEWSNGSINNAITVNQTGTYSVIVTTANGCSASTSISVTVYEQAQPVIAANGPTEFCEGGDVTLDVGTTFASVKWNNGSVNNSITVNQTGTYSAIVTTANGCSASTSISITVYDLPQPVITTNGPTQLCDGADVTLDVGTTFASVKWSNGSINNAITVNQTGIYTAIVTTANGCSASTSISVTQSQLPKPVIYINGPTEFCEGGDVNLDVGTTFASVKWSNGSTNNDINVTTAGLYWVVVTNAGGCSSRAEITVTVYDIPQPQITADGPTELCDGQDLKLDVGTTFASVKWSNGSENNAIRVDQAGIYTAIVTTANGCSATTSISVTVIDAPNPNITTNGPTEFCEGGNVTLDVGTTFASVKWSNGSINNAITVNQTGIYSAVVTSANGCSAATSISVTVFDLPQPAIAANGPTEFCDGDDVTLDVGTTFASVLWSNGSVNSAITVNQTGIYSAIVTTANGCSASTSISVTVYDLPQPVIAANGPTEFCADQNVTLGVGTTFASVLWSNGSVNNAITVNQTGIYSAVVTTANGCSASTSISVTVYAMPQPVIATNGPTEFCEDQDVTLDVGTTFASVLWSNGSLNNAITVNQTGIYTAIVTTANGCSTSTSISVTVYDIPQPVIATDGPTEFCEDQNVTLDVGTTFASVLWSNGSLNNAITVNQTGIYTAIVTTANGCSAATSISVTVYDIPQPVIATDGPTEFCEDQNVTLDVGTTFASVLWSNGSLNNAITVNQTGIYTAIVTTANGCSAATSISVTVYDIPQPLITTNGPTEFCEDQNVTLDVGTTFASVLWSNGSLNNAITVNQTGIYTAIVTTANGCSASTAISVTVYDLPRPVIAANGPTEFCADQDVTLDVGTTFASVLWSNGSLNNAITVNQTGVYTAIVTTANGCSAATSISVTVYDMPRPVIAANGPTEFCADQDVTLDVGTTFASVLWSNGSVNNAIAVNQTGIYTAIVTTANGCSASTSISVTVYDLPLPVIAANGPTEFCADQDVTLDVGTTFASVLWSNGSLNNAITVNQTGIYTAIVTTANGCSASTSISVTVYAMPQPVIAANGPTEFCADQDVTLDVGTTFASVLWSNGSVNNAITVSQSGVYTAIVTTANGCSSATSISITVNPLPTVQINSGGITEICEDQTLELDAGAGYASYLWSNGATSQTVLVNRSIVNATSANFNYSVTVANAELCSTSSSMTITVHAQPEITVTSDGPTAFCPGEDVTLFAPGGYAQYAWSNGATTQTLTISSTTSVFCTITSQFGCVSTTAVIDVRVNNPLRPEIVANGALEFCADETRLLDAGFGFDSYLWSNGATSQTIEISASGVYSVTVTNTNTCSGSTSISLTKRPLPVVNITADGPTSFCYGPLRSLDAGAGHSSYLWSNGATSQNIAVQNSGVYSVTVTNQFGCAQSSAMTITVWPLPTPTIVAAGPIELCEGEDVTLSVTGNYASLLWNNGSTQSSITVSSSGIYVVTAATLLGCLQSTAITVTVNSIPVLSLSADGPLEFCAGGEVELDAGNGHSTYAWSNGASTQTIIVNQSGRYQVTVSSISGCQTSAALQVTVNSIQIQAGLFLEGAFDLTDMRTDFADNSLLPQEQPFNSAPFNYGGTETIQFAAANISDWVLLELRDPDDPTIVLLRQAALLDNQGVVRRMDGSAGIQLAADFSFDSAYLVIHSPGHLSLISADKISIDAACAAALDFRQPNVAWRDFQDPTVEVRPGTFAAIAGDAAIDGFVNARDRVQVRRHLFEVGYFEYDSNRDGVVNAVDRIIVRNNSFKISQVP